MLWMRRSCSSACRHVWLIAWALLASVVLAHTGLTGLIAEAGHAVTEAHAGEREGACSGVGCGCSERCPGDAQDGSCGPQCDDCRCCAGSISALAPVTRTLAMRAQVFLALPAVPEPPSPGTHERIFRPPRPAPAC